MAKYELLPAMTMPKCQAKLRKYSLPELVHLEDPAIAVMTDFGFASPKTVAPDANIDDALHLMKTAGVHILLVEDEQHCIAGIVGSEDLLGEKPIKLIQENRISRAKVLVKMIMIPINQVTVFDIQTIKRSRVGNVVNTLRELRQHYALVVDTEENSDVTIIRGIFNTSQISRQLHTEVASSITKAESLLELRRQKE